MMSQQDLPPRAAVWLLSLFARADEAESILGDLLEEFLLLASNAGPASARAWYWRQTMKSIPRLAGVSFRTAPWMTAAAVAGGFLLRKLVAPLVGSAVFAVIERSQVYEHHFSAYIFLASTGIDIGHLITFLLIGFVVALAARQNEMVACMTLGLIFAAMAVVGSVYGVMRSGNAAFLWRLTWYFADALAVVVAGAMVRTSRLSAPPRASRA
jgi:hypothetical protein